MPNIVITREVAIESIWIKANRTIEIVFARNVAEGGEVIGARRAAIAIVPGADQAALLANLGADITQAFGPLIAQLVRLMHDPTTVATYRASVAANDHI